MISRRCWDPEPKLFPQSRLCHSCVYPGIAIGFVWPSYHIRIPSVGSAFLFRDMCQHDQGCIVIIRRLRHGRRRRGLYRSAHRHPRQAHDCSYSGGHRVRRLRVRSEVHPGWRCIGRECRPESLNRSHCRSNRQFLPARPKRHTDGIVGKTRRPTGGERQGRIRLSDPQPVRREKPTAEPATFQ